MVVLVQQKAKASTVLDFGGGDDDEVNRLKKVVVLRVLRRVEVESQSAINEETDSVVLKESAICSVNFGVVYFDDGH